MDKDKYLEIRKLERIEDDCYITIKKIDKFLEDNKEYINDFSKEGKEAIKKLKKYRELLSYRADCFSKASEKEFTKHRDGCKHEIVFYDNREGYKNDKFGYRCPLCRSYVSADEIASLALIIGVQDIYNLEDASQGSILYKVVDYLLEKGVYTKEEFDKALKLLVPKFWYNDYKENVKVMVKK